ncbi:MAG: Clp protease ClpB [Bacillales bacterium]
MSEELNVTPEVTDEQTTVEVPETKPDKTFTQDEVNKLLADRIAREKKKVERFADYDDLKTKASEYEKALEEKRLAELSAQERAEEIAKKFEAERNDFAKQLDELKSQAQREKVVNAFIKAAPGVNIPADRIDAALKLADLSAVSIGENGVEGLEDVMAALVTNYSFLAEVKKPQKPIGEATNSLKDTSEKTSEQLLKDAAEKAKRTQKIEDKIAYAALKAQLSK